MFFQSLLLAAFAFTSTTLAAFGVTTSGNNIVVDAGSTNTLKFTVNSKSCDITSILYRGEELQSQSQGTHISSGLGTATVKSEVISSKHQNSQPTL
jgi:rhamnogalacturonan endolyase